MTNLRSSKHAFHTIIDAILDLQKVIKTSNNHIILQYMEGHQYKHTKYKDLSPEAKFNVQIGRTADAFFKANPHPFKHKYDAPKLPTQVVFFLCDGCMIT